MDPVGNFGEGPAKVTERLKNAGILKVDLTIYEQARHECLNEIHACDVMHNLIEFCKSL